MNGVLESKLMDSLNSLQAKLTVDDSYRASRMVAMGCSYNACAGQCGRACSDDCAASCVGTSA
jgi:hypothetical protein